MDELENMQGKGEGASLSNDFVRQLVQSQNKIHAYILALVPDWNDADDILQDTAEIMWRKYGNNVKIDNFAALGMSVARNLIFSHFRNKKKHECLLQDDILENIAEYAQELSSYADDRVNVLRGCLAKLNGKDKELIRLRYEEGLNVKSVAQVSNRSVDGLYKSLGRIHDAIMRCVRSGLARENY